MEKIINILNQDLVEIVNIGYYDYFKIRVENKKGGVVENFCEKLARDLFVKFH